MNDPQAAAADGCHPAGSYVGVASAAQRASAPSKAIIQGQIEITGDGAAGEREFLDDDVLVERDGAAVGEDGVVGGDARVAVVWKSAEGGAR